MEFVIIEGENQHGEMVQVLVEATELDDEEVSPEDFFIPGTAKVKEVARVHVEDINGTGTEYMSGNSYTKDGSL